MVKKNNKSSQKQVAQSSTKAVLYRPPRQNKWIQFSLNQNGITAAAPYIACLNAVLQGTSNITRVGSKARMVEIDLIYKMSVTGANVTIAAEPTHRVVLVRDVAAEGALTTNGEVFQSASGTVSPRNYITVNPDRFLALHDYIADRNDYLPQIGANTTLTLAIQSAVKRVRMPLNFVTDYSRSNAGTVADIDSNGITIMVLTDNTVANVVNCEIIGQIRFTDE